MVRKALAVVTMLAVLLVVLASASHVTGVGRDSVPMQFVRGAGVIVFDGCDRCLPGARSFPSPIPDPPEYGVRVRLDARATRALEGQGMQVLARFCDAGDLGTAAGWSMDGLAGGADADVTCADGAGPHRSR